MQCLQNNIDCYCCRSLAGQTDDGVLARSNYNE